MAYVLVACGVCSDVVEVARRAEPLHVAAEMQWNLQPLRAFQSEQFSIAGQLIPAYEVGGDCFDYNVAADHLDLSSLDAMGHGVGASLLAGLATAVMRNVRRSGGCPHEQVAAADQQLLQQFGGAQFVTALAMRLDFTDGQLEIVNAGHPQPWRVREGQAEPLELDAQLPAGLFESTTYRTQTVQLKAGDRLVLVTDGVLEAGAPARSSVRTGCPGCCSPPPTSPPTNASPRSCTPSGPTPHACTTTPPSSAWTGAPRNTRSSGRRALMPAPHEQRVPCAQGTSVGRSPAPRTASAWCRGRHGLHAATASRSRREQSVCRIDAGPCDRRRFSCPDEPTSGPSRPRTRTRPADPAVAPGATYAEPAPVRASAEAGSCRLDKRLAGIRTTGSARAIGASLCRQGTSAHAAMRSLSGRASRVGTLPSAGSESSWWPDIRPVLDGRQPWVAPATCGCCRPTGRGLPRPRRARAEPQGRERPARGWCCDGPRRLGCRSPRRRPRRSTGGSATSLRR